MTKAEKVSTLRKLLAPYRGGCFTSSSSGGAGGMIFFKDQDGQEFYMGGFKPGDAENLCRILNLVLELTG